MSNELDDSVAAFPCPMSEQTILNQDSSPFQRGMSLRDYFAAKALPAYFSDGTGHSNDEQAAKWAYRIADAMLKARG
jgi:hypothetical protein